MNTAELDAIRQRVEAATPGPWSGDRRDGTVKYRVLGADDKLVLQVDHKSGEYGFIGERGDDDEAFVLNARTHIPNLLAEVIRLRSALVEVELAAGRGALAEAGAIAAAALGEEKQA